LTDAGKDTSRTRLQRRILSIQVDPTLLILIYLSGTALLYMMRGLTP
jgi:hypothetical protein